MRVGRVFVALAVVSALLPTGDLFGASVAQAQTGELCDTGSVGQFTDIEAADYAAQYILCMSALGLSVGWGDGTYGADQDLTRGQMASFLVRLWKETLGRACPEGPAAPFTDISGNTHETNIECLYALGITKGVTATTYGPRDPLKASQISRFLLRTYQHTDRTCPTTSSSSSELDQAVNCLYNLRVIPTTEEGASPDPVNRAQMAVYVIGLWHNLTGRGLPPTPPQKPTAQPDTPPPSATTQRIAYSDGYRDSVGLWIVNTDGTNLTQLTNDYVSEWGWSPDGTRVAYTTYDRETSTSSLWIVNTDGTNPKLGRGNTASWLYNSQWSPDGTRVAYTTYDRETSTSSLWVVNADGTNPKLLANDASYKDWSPDGTRVAYTTYDGETSTGSLWVVNADSTNPKQLTNTRWLYDSLWSPDGTRIAYPIEDSVTYIRSLWVANADGTNSKQLTDTAHNLSRWRWSPDGTSIAYEISDGGTGTNSLWVVNADGTNPKKLTDNTTSRLIDSPWSPNGTRVAYEIFSGETGWGSLWVVNADGANPKKLTNNTSDKFIIDSQWSPDGTQIAYATYDGETSTGSLWVVNADSTNPKKLTSNTMLDSPWEWSWNWGWSPDGTSIAYEVLDGWPGSLWVVNTDGTNPKQLSFPPNLQLLGLGVLAHENRITQLSVFLGGKRVTLEEAEE